MRKSLLLPAVLSILFELTNCSTDEIVRAAESGSLSVAGEINDGAIKVLQNALIAQKDFIKVHAAEALLATKYNKTVQPVFEKQLTLHGNIPFARIGIWRVLAQAESDKTKRDQYFVKLADAAFDLKSPDCVDAAESLAKLQYVIPVQQQSRFADLLKNASGSAVPYRRWMLAAQGTTKEVRYLAELLESPDPEVRGNTAYALRHLAHNLPSDVAAKLAKVATNETKSAHRVYLISSAYVMEGDGSQTEYFKSLLLPYARTGEKDEKYEAAAVLGIRGTSDDLPLLAQLLKDAEADVQVGAANAIVRIHQRH